MRAAVATMALALGACVEPPPRLPAEAPPVAVEVVSPPAANPPRSDAPTAEEASWQRLAQQLEADNGRLEQERDHWKAEAERYHAGLERAVAELNRPGAAVSMPRPATAPQPAVAPGSVYPTGPAFVQPMLEGWGVSGRLWNSGSTDAPGTLTVELLRDGQVQETKFVQLTAPAGVETPYQVVFGGPTDRVGTYNARVRFDGR